MSNRVLKSCKISGCLRKYDSKGFCKKHYDNNRLCGNPLSLPRQHGQTGTREHNSWLGMRQRCYYKKHKDYKYYGAKGIEVCERWRVSFKNFLEDMGPRPIGTTLDRIDSNKNYSPENCQWATYSEQAANRKGWASSGRKYVYHHNGKFQVAKGNKYYGTFDSLKLARATIQTVEEQTVAHQTVIKQNEVK